MSIFRKLTLCGLFLFLVSCGKVVQESTEKKEDPVFRVSFSIPVVTKNASVNDIFIEKTLYATVYSYEVNGTKKELSWGQGKVDVKALKLEGKAPLKAYASKALNKKGIEISGADNTWAKATLVTSPEKSNWDVDAAKLKKGSHGYLVAAFTDTSHYRLKWVSKQDVSGNVSLELKTLELYDTFLAILRLMRVQDGDARLSYDEKFKNLFNPSFFNAMNYSLPENKTPEFDPEKPQFFFDRLLEKTLLSIWELYCVDPKEALGYLRDIKPEVLPVELKTLLITSIQESQKSPKKP